MQILKIPDSKKKHVFKVFELGICALMRDVSCLIECEPSSIFGASSDGNLFGTD